MKRKTALERVEELARSLHGPRTKVLVYRDPEIGTWCVDLMSGRRFITSTSIAGTATKGETLRAVLDDLKVEAQAENRCPTCGRAEE